MAVDLDDTDWSIINELQQEARLSFTELAKRVHLSPSATTERVKRLETLGVITGYCAQLDLAAVGIGLVAVVWLKYHGNRHDPFLEYLEQGPQFLESLRITGEDCYVITLAATSMPQLQRFVDDLARFGDTTTSVVYSHALAHRGPIRPLTDL